SVAQHSGDQPYDTVRYQGRRQLSARNHIIADGHFGRDVHLPDALIYAFVVAAQDDQVLFQRIRVGRRLVPWHPVGGHVDHLVVLPFGFQGADTAVYRLGHHHHSGPSAESVVVRAVVTVKSVVVQVVQVQIQIALVAGPPHDGLLERADQQIRHAGNNVYSHSIIPPSGRVRNGSG